MQSVDGEGNPLGEEQADVRFLTSSRRHRA